MAGDYLSLHLCWTMESIITAYSSMAYHSSSGATFLIPL